MSELRHRFNEGDRVEWDHVDCGRIETRTGTVVQAVPSSPHITQVKRDGESNWRMIGTAHIRGPIHDEVER